MIKPIYTNHYLPIRNSWHGKKRPAVPRRPRQELKDVGVSVEALDKEGLVQAVVQQLSWRGVLTTGEDMGGWNEVGIT